MKTITDSSLGSLQGLYEWCHAARNHYDASMRDFDSPGLRALKLYLAERHAEHVRELRHCLYVCGGMPQSGTMSLRALPDLSGDIVKALVAPNRSLVILACGLVEEHMARAYERALHALPEDLPVRETITRHHQELEESQAFVHDIHAEKVRGAAASNGALLAG